MSFDAGFLLGLSMGGGTPKPKHDGDYQKWLDLPEPNENQAVFLIRVTDLSYSVTILADQIDSSDNSIIADAFFIDWGDGSTELFPSNNTNFYHQYDSLGEYIIIFTDNAMTKRFPRVLGHLAYKNIMTKYNENASYPKMQNFQSHEYLRYVRLPKNTEFNAAFFLYCYALREIEYNGIITNLYPSMFDGCRALNFDNIKFDNSISSVGNYCFNECYDLRGISLPNCTSVGAGAFRLCYGLSDITLSDDCTFETGCFNQCYSLYPKPDGSIEKSKTHNH